MVQLGHGVGKGEKVGVGRRMDRMEAGFMEEKVAMGVEATIIVKSQGLGEAVWTQEHADQVQERVVMGAIVQLFRKILICR